MASSEGGTLKSCLRAAREALSKKEYKDAIKEARAALKHDKRSYEAFLFIGKAAFSLEEYAQADVAYRKAVEINADGVPAWQGLAELHAHTGDHEKLAEACQHLVDTFSAAGQAERAAQFRSKLVQALMESGRREEARKVWEEVAKAAKQGSGERIEALCALTDIAVIEHAESVEREVLQRSSRQKKLAKAAAKSGNADTAPVDLDGLRMEIEAESAPMLDKLLAVLVAETEPVPKYAKHHLLHLERAVACLRQATRGSYAEAANTVLARSLRMIHTGSSVPEPFLVALAFCEEDATCDLQAWQALPLPKAAEEAPWQKRAFVRLGQSLVHSFPGQGLGWIAVAAGLYASQEHRPSPDVDDVKALCQMGLRLDAESLTGWRLLGQLQLVEGSSSGALQCAHRGLEALVTLRKRYGLRVRRAEFELQILESCALIESGQADEAAEKLRDVETEAGSSLAGRDRDDVIAAAVVGQARASLTSAAGAPLVRLALERVLSVQPENDWAYSQLGLLALRSENERAGLDEARRCFEKAAELKPDNASYHFELGQVYWRLGGVFRSDRQYAHAQFLEAARLDVGLARAFTYLGRYYAEVQQDETRARRCFQKAVQLDADEELAGTTLADMMASSGQRKAEIAMCRDACVRSARAYWAWRRLGFLEARAGRWQEALVGLQHALRGDSKNADAWEALALAYQRLGKLTAALKAYGQAEKLAKAEDRIPFFTLLQAASIHDSLGNFRKAGEKFQAVLSHVPTQGAALAGAAASLLGQARHYKQQGAWQAAADLLRDAGAQARKGAALYGNTRPLWKLLGDIHLELALVAPPKESEDSNSSSGNAPANSFLHAIEVAREVQLQAFKSSERAYRRAVHLNPMDANGWAELGTCLKHRADFVHPPEDEKHKPLHWGWGKSTPAAGTRLGDSGLLLKTLAERLVMGALSLAPTDAAHWATLGVVATERAVQQHALIRALQIHPKLGAAWVNLGQLYLAESDFELAQAAFDHARSCDPVLAVPWASMAYMEAKEARDPKHKQEALSTARHAVRTGPVPEGQLGFGALAAELGMLDDPEPLIALKKAALQLPAVAAVHNLLGLAYEARGLFSQAVESFQNARGVLGVQKGGPEEQDDVTCNLARALVRTGQHAEAVREFEKLQHAGALQSEASAPSWRLYGTALWHCGQSEAASAALLQALQLAPPPLPEEDPPKEHVAALCALACMQCHVAGPQQALRTLKESVPECWRDAHVGMTALALATLAQDNSIIAYTINTCPALFGREHAPQANRLLSIAHRLQGKPGAALRHLRTALHSSPASQDLRTALSQLLRSEARPQLARRVIQGCTSVKGDTLSVDELGESLREAAACLAALGWEPDKAEQNGRLLCNLQRWIKINPTAEHARTLLAFAAALRAQICTAKQSERWRSVRRLCQTGLQALGSQKRIGEGRESKAQNQDRVERLLLSLLHVEALSRSPNAEEREQGVRQALQLADRAKGDLREGLARAQLARCHVAAGDEEAAEGAFSDAIEVGGRVQDYLAQAALQGASGSFEAAFRTLEKAEHALAARGSQGHKWAAAIHVARADLLLKRGDVASAAAVASDAVSDESDNPVLLLLQGALLARAAEDASSGEVAAQARRALSRSVHLLRGSNRALPWAHYELGLAELVAGRRGREKGEASMRTACREWPNIPQPAELLYQLAQVAAPLDETSNQVKPEPPGLSHKTLRRMAVHAQPACATYWAQDGKR